ncbi:hypothetical protein J5N97_025667 [Dioscorea zingiberensis]|uniref:Uncharacterized protein n=1 Tax=Dioscorea zingiberensis TaxID=325984 RepID=A0A9D5C188_9LILI|nr:hypothetical protein J5N97_025667 [Dioscorea zingiberensis]
MASPSQEDYTRTLLSAPPPRPSPHRTLSLLLLLTFISFFSSLAFALLFLSSSSTTQSLARYFLSVLRRPTVILISVDGFRYGYQFKCPTPNIHHLISNGTRSPPACPRLPYSHLSQPLFHRHGLYPESHSASSTTSSSIPSLRRLLQAPPRTSARWLGEPLTGDLLQPRLQGRRLYRRLEVSKGSWDCPHEFCPKYDSSVPFEKRVDDVLSYSIYPLMRSRLRCPLL